MLNHNTRSLFQHKFFAQRKTWKFLLVLLAGMIISWGITSNLTARVTPDVNASMKELRSFAVMNPRQIAVDRQGDLWIIQRKDYSTHAEIVHYSKEGKVLPSVVANVENPTAIAVDRQDRLLVAENGSRQQVLIYTGLTQK